MLGKTYLQKVNNADPIDLFLFAHLQLLNYIKDHHVGLWPQKRNSGPLVSIYNKSMLKEKDEIIYISFNQDQTYVAVATQKGFKVFKMDEEIELAIVRDFGAGIGIIEMIHKTNIFAMVGGGQTPRHPKNKLMICDDCTSCCLLSSGKVRYLD